MHCQWMKQKSELLWNMPVWEKLWKNYLTVSPHPSIRILMKPVLNPPAAKVRKSLWQELCIAVFRQGEIAEYGSHDELLAKDGIYSELFSMQAQFYV